MCSLHDVFGGHDHVNGNYLPRPPHVVEVEQNNSQKGKKNRVALFVQPNVRLLLWTDPNLHTKYNRFLPPALPMRSSSKESLISVGSAAPSPSQPLDDLSSPPPIPQTSSPPPPPPSPLPPPTTSSDATLIMMSFMQSFPSDVSSLRSELQGSVSSLVDKALSSWHLAPLQTENSTGAASPGWRDGSSTWPVGHSTLSWCG